HVKFSEAPTARLPVKPASTGVNVAQLLVPVTFTPVIATLPLFSSWTVIVTAVPAGTVVPGRTLTMLSVVAGLPTQTLEALSLPPAAVFAAVPVVRVIVTVDPLVTEMADVAEIVSVPTLVPT